MKRKTFKSRQKGVIKQRVGQHLNGEWWADRYVYRAALGCKTKAAALKQLAKIS